MNCSWREVLSALVKELVYPLLILLAVESLYPVSPSYGRYFFSILISILNLDLDFRIYIYLGPCSSSTLEQVFIFSTSGIRARL